MIPIKMHHMPGDVGRSVQIAMLEGTHRDRKRSKAFRNMVYSRLRAVLKERARREIEANT